VSIIQVTCVIVFFASLDVYFMFMSI